MERVLSYRGLWIIFSCVTLGIGAVWLAPDGYGWPIGVVSILGAWVGGGLFARDYYLHIKAFERERDEFNSRFRNRR